MFLSEQCEQLVMVTKIPQCSRCFGTNWIDLGKIEPNRGKMLPDGEIKQISEEKHLFQCGGGIANTDPNEMKNGCGRVIRATPEEMSKEGQI